MKFTDYYKNWIDIYKKGAVRQVTLDKYMMAVRWIENNEQGLQVEDINRQRYQGILNKYAETHERQTTMDFHHLLKAALLDAMDDGYIAKDPTRRVVIKGKEPREKKIKYLSKFEFQKLMDTLVLGDKLTKDYFILLVAKTGLRFSEALGITPADFDFKNATLTINKTWNYKNGGGFDKTKNTSSVRTIPIDWQSAMKFSILTADLPKDKPIFIEDGKQIYSTVYNYALTKKCKQAGIPVITMHGLRHTHASILMADGVSIAGVSMRLGHASISTTQKVYLHLIKELENKDTDIIMRSIVGG